MPFMRGGGGGGHSVSRTTTRTTTSHAPASRGGGGGLPAGWKSAIDKQSGQTYYVHRSGQTQWQRP